MLWTKQQVETATKILGRYSRVCDALPEIEKTINRKVTTDSLKHAMKQRGADAPSYYLQRDLVEATDSLPLVGGQVANLAKELMQKQFGSHLSKPDFFSEAERKAESAWIRNIDSITKEQIEEAIRPPDGLTLNRKPYTFTITDEEMWKVPGTCAEINYGEKITKIMVLPDCHVPYHDKKAWKVFLKACKAVKPDILVIIGDLLDFLAVSSHTKSPADNTNFQTELAAGLAALDELQDLGIPRVVYCEGNHETRITRYIADKAPELYGMMHVKDLLKISDRPGWEWYPYGDLVRIGEMTFVHDIGRCGINTARQSLQDMGDNICVGHSHRASVVYSGTVEGKTHVGINVGHLLDYEQVTYRNRNTAKREWQHSFGLIYQDSKGISYCNLIPIINGSCIVDGKLVRVK